MFEAMGGNYTDHGCIPLLVSLTVSFNLRCSHLYSPVAPFKIKALMAKVMETKNWRAPTFNFQLQKAFLMFTDEKSTMGIFFFLKNNK